MNILMVEDDQGLSQALKKILEDNGHSVDAVFDGVAGLEYGTSDLYDVIILDVMLPKKDGFAMVLSVAFGAICYLTYSQDAAGVESMMRETLVRPQRMVRTLVDNACGYADGGSTVRVL